MKNLSTRLAALLLLAAMPAYIGEAAQVIPQPAAAELVVLAKIARNGDFIAYGFGSLWMVSGTHLVRVDPKTNGFDEIKIDGLGGLNRGIAIGENALWVPDLGSQTIYRIDPIQNRVTLRIPAVLADSEGSIGVGEGAVWVVTTAGEGVTSKNYNHTLSRFNAQTGILEATLHLPAQGASVIVADGSVWITGINKAELYRLDPRTNQIKATISLHKRPRFMTAGGGAIWVLNQGDGTVQRVDTLRNTVAATIEAGAQGGGGDIAFGDGHVWVTSPETPVIKINATANTLVGRYDVSTEEFNIGDAIRYGASSLWVSGGNIFRIEPP